MMEQIVPESIAYAGQPPWHGVGTPVEGAMTAKEAIQHAKLDWEVLLYPCFIGDTPCKDGESEYSIVMDDRFVLARDYDQRVYNIVSSRYRPIQNYECFEFFDSVVQSDAAKYHTVGSLRGGAVVWLLAKLNGVVEVKM